MIRRLASVLVLFCATAAGAETPGVVLVFADHAVVDGADIRLGDVASIRTADSDLRAQLEKLRLAPAPVASIPRRLRSDAITQLVERTVTRVALTAQGARQIAVERRTVVYPATRQIEQARQYLLQRLHEQYPALGQVDIAAVGDLPDLSLPAGAIDARPRPLQGNGLAKRVCVWLDLRVDGKTYRSVPVWLSVAAHGPALVARHAIKPRESVQPSDFVQEDRDVAELGSPALTTVADLAGQRARTFIPAGAIAQRKDFEPNPSVRADETVDVRVTAGAIVIETQAVAEEDGRVGDTVRVRNPITASIFTARVVGDKLVAITER